MSTSQHSLQNARLNLQESRVSVIKFGSAILTNDGEGLAADAIDGWVEQIARLRKAGKQIVLVSSGAVAAGMRRLGMEKRPHAIHELQAAAAVGQSALVEMYESCFAKRGIHTAQVLLTHDDLSDRRRYLNAGSAIRTLLSMGVVPIVNENDTVAVDEICFGDNDTLAALVANLIEADLLVILTDQLGMYDADPRTHPEAKLLDVVVSDDPKLDAMAAEGIGTLGRGGMQTKVRAARLAARSGASTLIAPGRKANVLEQVFQAKSVGTLFMPGVNQQMDARKRWLAGHLQMSGALVLDNGAVQVLRESGKSLLAVGVHAVEGEFQRGDVVALMDSNHREIARGLVNYPSQDLRKICGQGSQQIEQLLGYVDEEEIIHRDNLVMV